MKLSILILAILAGFCLGFVTHQRITQPRHRSFDLLVEGKDRGYGGWYSIIPFDFDLEELADTPTQVYEDSRILVKIVGVKEK